MHKPRSDIVNVDEVRLPGNWVLRLARGLNCPSCGRPAAIYRTRPFNSGTRIDCVGCGGELITFKPATKATATAIAAAAIPHEEKASQ